MIIFDFSDCTYKKRLSTSGLAVYEDILCSFPVSVLLFRLCETGNK